MPSDVIAAYDPNWGAGLLGDKSHSMIFDNTKIKRLVPDFECRIPFSRGAAEIVAWYDADPARRKVNEEFNRRATGSSRHGRVACRSDYSGFFVTEVTERRHGEHGVPSFQRLIAMLKVGAQACPFALHRAPSPSRGRAHFGGRVHLSHEASAVAKALAGQIGGPMRPRSSIVGSAVVGRHRRMPPMQNCKLPIGGVRRPRPTIGGSPP